VSELLGILYVPANSAFMQVLETFWILSYFSRWYLVVCMVARGIGNRILEDLVGIVQVATFLRSPASLQLKRDYNEQEMQYCLIWLQIHQ
jgi:hypothetical protein